MSESDDQPLFESVLAETRESWMNEVHTSFPARVDSYNAAAQTADLTPMVRRAMPTTDDRLASENYPTLRAVRIAWLRAGDWFIHMPLARGDFVHVHCCERDFTAWAQTGDVGDPVNTQTQHLSHAFAVPGFYPRTKPLNDTPSDALVIGKQGGATVRINNDGSIDVKGSVGDLKKLATVDEVRAELLKIAAAFAGAVAPSGGGALTFAPGTAYPVLGVPTSEALGTTTTRAT